MPRLRSVWTTVAGTGALWLAASCGSRASLDDQLLGDSGDASTGSGASAATGAGAQGSSATGSGAQSTGPGPTGSGAGGPGTGSGSGGAGPGSGPGGATAASTGSGTMTCPTNGTPCIDCIAQTCPEFYCNCYENAECLALFQCSGSCNGDMMCQQSCLSAHQDGISDVLLVSDCAATSCDGSCTWGNPVKPCTKCILQDCSDEMNTCLADPECLVLFNCLTGCMPIDLMCQQACYDAHGAGVPALQAVLECSAQECMNDCP